MPNTEENTLGKILLLHPVRTFAMLCVACTSAYLGILSWKLIDTLSAPRWCATALQAEKISDSEKPVGLESCQDLLMVQLKTLGTDSHIVIGAFAFSLVVLVVIVLAGANLKGSLFGNQIDLRGAEGDKAAAAQFVADKAQGAAQEVKVDPAVATSAAPVAEDVTPARGTP